MIFITFLFWVSTSLVVYTYFGYPLLLMTVSAARQLRSDWRHVSRTGDRRVARDGPPLRVAVLVSAYNEERHIVERVRNLLAQSYAPERLHIYVGSDASDDGTAEAMRAMASDRLTFVDYPGRRGKASVVNDLAAMATEDLLIFTDANTAFAPDTVQKLVRHFGDAGVGCVCGELRLVRAGAHGDNQDHFYWRYERLLKFFESRIGGLLGANGGVYAVRREHYAAIPSSTIVDDFWISMQVVESGRRCVYDPEAVATETTPERIAEEFRRRVRIGVGNYQSLWRFAGLLSPARGAICFTFLSHKVLRWFAPHCMTIALLCNVALAADSAFYALWLAAQVVFYGGAWIGWHLARGGLPPRLLRVPLFFVSMNLGLLVGFWKFATQSASGVWSRSAR